MPIYLVLRDYKAMWIAVLFLAGTTIFLKRSWYDRLQGGGCHRRFCGTDDAMLFGAFAKSPVLLCNKRMVPSTDASCRRATPTIL
ncbi:MAG TPA: hypothetical protein VMY42_24895 [Thermoguttaceae bacterium]|nr:hypothetical protein [Thermoguttaceae bacterium]